MSQENVEIAQSVLWVGADVLPLARDDATWERHRADLEPSVEPECQFAWVGDGQRVEVTGLEQSRRFWRDFFKSWETVGCELERIVPLGNKVLALTRLHARMAGSQQELEMIAASVVVVEGGRISSVEHYANRAEALEAVGLREWAMSQEDAAKVRRAYEVWNESGPAAVIDEFWAEDAVYREGPGWPDAGVYRGRAAALERMQSLVELVGPLEVRVDDLIDLGDGRLVACVRTVGQDAASDTPYTQSFAVVHRLRGGLIVEADYYLDRAAALDAVGLRE